MIHIESILLILIVQVHELNCLGPLGMFLPVHHDAMEDDDEANVKDEVDDDCNQGKNKIFSFIGCATDDESDHVEDEESVTES